MNNQTPSKLEENLSDCIEDTADNFIFEHPDYYHLEPQLFESALFQVLKAKIETLIEDFSLHPEKYLSEKNKSEFQAIASQSLAESFP